MIKYKHCQAWQLWQQFGGVKVQHRHHMVVPMGQTREKNTTAVSHVILIYVVK